MLHIIDFDDTLFYTSHVIRIAYQDASRKVLNRDDIFTKENWEWAKDEPLGFVEPILKKYDLMHYYDELKEYKHQSYPRNYLDQIKPNVLLLEELFYKQAMPWDLFIICSNSDESDINIILEYYKVDRYFNDVIGRNTYLETECKPSTSMYHRILSEYDSVFDIDPSMMLYDDSWYGLKACNDFNDEVSKLYPHVKVDIINVSNEEY